MQDSREGLVDHPPRRQRPGSGAPDLPKQANRLSRLAVLQTVKGANALRGLEDHGEGRRLQTRIDAFELSPQQDRMFRVDLPGGRACERGNRSTILVILHEHLVDEEQVAVPQYRAMPKHINS